MADNSKNSSIGAFLLTPGAISVTTAKSSGPGGQHVQKTETKVRISYYLSADQTLTDEQKNKIRSWLKSNKPKHYLMSNDTIIAEDQSSRSQANNFEAAKKKIISLIKQALAVHRKRIATKPSKGAIEKRLTSKKISSITKIGRRKVIEE
jgi:ribosome-associated protein